MDIPTRSGCPFSFRDFEFVGAPAWSLWTHPLRRAPSILVKDTRKTRFEEAIAQYQTVKNTFPQWYQYATTSELEIANIQYEREFFIEAQNAYQVFKELHPRHPKSDFVTYRLAMSFFKQLPETIDRDLSLANQAILYFDEVASSYAASKFAKKAREAKKKCLQMQAEKILYIADFYFVRDYFQSSLNRYEEMLRTYPKIGLNDRALYGAAVSANRIDSKEKEAFYLKKLRSEHPDSVWAQKAEKELM